MATKKTPSTKTSSSKTTSPKTTTKKTPAKKAPTKKPPAKKIASTTANSKKPAATKPNPKRAPTKKTARKPSSKQAAAKQADGTPVKARRKRSKLSGLDRAAIVLAEAREPLGIKEITKRVITAGWQTKGKTPHATLYAAMLREIAGRGKDSRFAKTGRNEFKATGKGAS